MSGPKIIKTRILMSNSYLKPTNFRYICPIQITNIMNFKLSISCFLITMFIGFNSFSQIIAPQYINNNPNFLPAYFSVEEGASTTDVDFSSWVVTQFNLDENIGFIKEKTETDNLGYTHHIFKQSYMGTPVYGFRYVLHVQPNGKTTVSGKALRYIKSNSQLTLSENEALQAALRFMNADAYMWQFEDAEQVLKNFMENPEATYYPTGNLVYINPNLDFKSPIQRLAWSFNIFAKTPLMRKQVFVDAQNGEIITSFNLLHDINVPGKANTKYSGMQTIIVDSIAADSFILRDNTRGKGIETYNLKNGTSISSAVDFVDNDNYWDNVNSQKDEFATDAHWATEMTYDYYLNVHGRNSIDGNGFKLRSYVHYSNNYANAFWNGQWMTYGDGNSSMNPLVSVDIAGHEISHGLTTNTANLAYQKQSGALNESFSDIFGNLIELYAKPITASWLMGENTGRALRSMANPNLYRDPDCMKGLYYIETDGCVPSSVNDNCGVHTNSSIQNFWFYLLAQGGSGTNDLGNKYSVPAIGADKAGAITFRNLTVYLSSTADFMEARFFSIRAAADLYGECSSEVDAVIKAWYAVGVGDSSRTVDFYADATSRCAPPFTVNFKNISDAYENYYWDFGDGSTSKDLQPQHTYTSFGKYNVKLIASGTCGQDSISKANYIDVDSSKPCTFKMAATDSHDTIDLCTGTLFDDGGPDGDYTGDHDAITTIAPPGAEKVTLSFKSFAFEGDCDCDWLYIYDGPSTSSPLIGKYSGFDLPEGGVVSSTGGAITLLQSTDPAKTFSGFELNWFCTLPGAKPYTDFYAKHTSSCNGKVEFMAETFNDPTKWEWDFGDGTYSSDKNPTHFYQKNGNYTVSLKATNEYGSTSESKTDYITINMPTSSQIQNQESCGSDSFTFMNNGNGNTYWYEMQTSSTPFYIGDTLNTGIINSSRHYYYQTRTTPPPLFTGLEKRDDYPGGYYSNSNYHGEIFDCYKEVTLKSVKVYANTKGTRTIVLKDASGTTLLSKNIDIQTLGEQRIELNFRLPVKNNLQLGCEPTANLYRNSSNVEYPIVLGSILSIHNTTAGLQGYEGYYYFFYDWEIQEDDCTSPRLEVYAYVNNNAPTANFGYTVQDSVVSFHNLSADGNRYIWDFGDGNYDSSSSDPTHIYSNNQNYNVKLTALNGCGNNEITKQVSTIGSINEINNLSVQIYPNPAQSILNVSIESKLSTPSSFRITNTLGKVVFTKELNTNNGLNRFSIDVNNFSKGMYLVEIKGKHEVFVKKIMIGF